jgi:hypothetical protein
MLPLLKAKLNGIQRAPQKLLLLLAGVTSYLRFA